MIAEYKLADEKNKQEIKRMKESIDYMYKSLKNMRRFTSSFEEGFSLSTEN